MSEIDWMSLHKNATTVLEGDFPVMVKEAKAAQTQNGKKMFKLKFEITAGPYAGRTIFHNMTVSPESQFAMQRFFADMAVLGADVKFFSGKPTDDLIVSQITNRHAIATLEKREYNGKEQESIKTLAVATGSPVAVASAVPAATALPKAQPTPTPVSDDTPPEDPFAV